MKCLIYCTKRTPKTQLIDNRNINNKFELCWCLKNDREQLKNRIVNGKVVAEFDSDKVGDIKLHIAYSLCSTGYHTFVDRFYSDADLQKASCLNGNELMQYLKGEKDNEIVGYAIHIKNLKVFDKPLELGGARDYGNGTLVLPEKAPQNMQRVYWYNADFSKKETYVLISIQPQWVAKILNGEKTIEVRKKVLKGGLEK